METKKLQFTKEQQTNIMKKQPLLSVQDLETLNPDKVTPLSPEVISRQATINIGMSNIETSIE